MIGGGSIGASSWRINAVSLLVATWRCFLVPFETILTLHQLYTTIIPIHKSGRD